VPFLPERIMDYSLLAWLLALGEFRPRLYVSEGTFKLPPPLTTPLLLS